MRGSLVRLFGAAVLLISLAVFLRFVPISSESVEGDELFSRRVAMSETSRALDLVRQDLVHPPLYYLLLKLTLPGGRPASPLDIRLLSLAAGAASILVVILIGWAEVPLRGPAVCAALLLAVNKLHIFYSQQARSPALFCLLAGILLFWAVLMESQGNEWTYWLAGTILMAALLYTHYFGAFYCAAVLLPVLLTDRRKRFGVRAVASLALACAAFLPWMWQVSAVYREKSGLSPNLGWHAPPTMYDLEVAFAHSLGLPDFRGATSLVVLVGAMLVVGALFPDAGKDGLDVRSRMTLALTVFLPPLLVFLLSRPPFRLPIFDERHLLPSVLAMLLLVSYGLWRLASRVSPPVRTLCLAAGVVLLSLFQALPVWGHWPGPSRQPYAAVAGWLRTTDVHAPVYTTWPYGIGEPVAFYLEGSWRVEALPSDPMMLPEESIVLYRPAAETEDAAVRSLLPQFDIIRERDFAAPASRWGTRLLVLKRHRP